MKPEHVVAVALRLFAIFLAVSILSFLAASHFDDSIARPAANWASFEDIQAVAFTVMGVYFLFRAISGTIYWSGLFIGSPFDPDPQQWASMLETFAEFVLACFLVFGARGLGQLISKVRNIGIH